MDPFVSLETYLSLPKTTIPTLSVSKLSAIPLTPELNSTISPACTLVRPNTRAIPSPIEMTVPNSLRSFYSTRTIKHGFIHIETALCLFNKPLFINSFQSKNMANANAVKLNIMIRWVFCHDYEIFAITWRKLLF